MQRPGDTVAKVGQSRSRNGGESREALAFRLLHVQRWHPRVGDFFSFASPGASLAHLITALSRKGFMVARTEKVDEQ